MLQCVFQTGITPSPCGRGGEYWREEEFAWGCCSHCPLDFVPFVVACRDRRQYHRELCDSDAIFFVPEKITSSEPVVGVFDAQSVSCCTLPGSSEVEYCSFFVGPLLNHFRCLDNTYCWTLCQDRDPQINNYSVYNQYFCLGLHFEILLGRYCLFHVFFCLRSAFRFRNYKIQYT